MKRSKTERSIRLGIISFLIATLLWLYIAEKEEFGATSDSRTIELKYYNVPDNYNYNGPGQVEVKVWGTLNISDDNIIAYVDLNGLGPGSYELPVHMNPIPGALFNRVIPDKVNVTLLTLLQRELPIEIKLTNIIENNYIIDKVSFPNNCLLQGEEQIINSIVSINASVSPRPEKSLNQFDVKLQAIDKDGAAVNGNYRIIPDHANIYVSMTPVLIEKDLEVQVVTTASESTDQIVKSIICDPSNVKVLGTEEELEKLGAFILTKKVDLGDFNEDGNIFSTIVELDVAQSIKAYPAKVWVTIELERAKGSM